MKKNKLFKQCLIGTVAIGTMFQNSGVLAQTSISTEQELIGAIDTGSGSYSVDDTIILTTPLQISSDITLTGSGTIKLSDDWSATTSPISIADGGSLTIDGITIDGNKDNVSLKVENGGLISIDDGMFTLENGTLQNTLIPQYGDDNHGVVQLNEGAFVMNGGSIQNNTLYGYSGSCGIVNVKDSLTSEPNTFTLNGGSITNNDKSAGVFVGIIGGSSNNSVFTMNGGEISYNDSTPYYDDGGYAYFEDWSSWYAGGVYVNGGKMIMNGGSINNNKSLFYGGGIAIVANSSGNQGLIMNGGTVANNESRYGAGIFLSGITSANYTAELLLQGGEISGNTANGGQGGAVYITKDQTATLKNALIYENSAKGIGGGIWTCSTGNMKMYVTNGGAVYDNTADGSKYGSAGADLAFVKHDEEEPSLFVLSERILGGSKATYYKDAGIIATSEANDGFDNYYLGVGDGNARFDTSDPGEAITDVSDSTENYALKSVLTDDAKDAASSYAKLRIHGNSAFNGGGIGANGSIIIGEDQDASLSIEKQWDKVFADDEKKEINVSIMSNGYEIETVTLNADNKFKATVTGLPIGDYTVEEENTEGYDVSYSDVVFDEEINQYSVTITNKKAIEMTSIAISKQWVGEAQDTATVHLLKDGEIEDTVELSKSNNWSHTFTDLPKTDADYNEYEYSISEDTPSGYTSKITGNMEDGFVVTNTKDIEYTSVDVDKQWNGPACDSVTVNLLADGEVKDTVALTADNDWHHTFTDLPMTDEDYVPIIYSVEETPTEGYTTSIAGNAEDGFIISNTKTIEYTSIHVQKNWVGPKADSVTVNLLENGTVINTTTLSDDNNWECTFEHLPTTTDQYEELTYTIEEEAVDGYTSAITDDEDGYVITNTKDIEYTSVTVNKLWKGEPTESATVYLMANGEQLDGIVLSETTGWTHTFDNLPTTDAEYNAITYEVSEEPIEGYSTTITGNAASGFTIWNTQDIETTNITVSKKWVGTATDFVKVNLLRDGTVMKTVELSDTNNWAFTFTDLPKTDNDYEAFAYTVSEETPEGYTCMITGDMANGFVITNTKIKEDPSETPTPTPSATTTPQTTPDTNKSTPMPAKTPEATQTPALTAPTSPKPVEKVIETPKSTANATATPEAKKKNSNPNTSAGRHICSTALLTMISFALAIGLAKVKHDNA